MIKRLLTVLALIVFATCHLSFALERERVTRQNGGSCGETVEKVYECAEGLACTNGTCQQASYKNDSDSACFAEMQKRGHNTNDAVKIPVRYKGYCYISADIPELEDLAGLADGLPSPKLSNIKIWHDKEVEEKRRQRAGTYNLETDSKGSSRDEILLNALRNKVDEIDQLDGEAEDINKVMYKLRSNHFFSMVLARYFKLTPSERASERAAGFESFDDYSSALVKLSAVLDGYEKAVNEAKEKAQALCLKHSDSCVHGEFR